MRKIEYVVSNERLITPSGLSLVGQVLGKSNLIKKVNRMRTEKRSQPQIKNGDILLTMIGLLSLGKSDFENVNEFHKDEEFYKIALGITYGIPSESSLRNRLDGIGTSMNQQILDGNVDMFLSCGYIQPRADVNDNKAREHDQNAEPNIVNLRQRRKIRKQLHQIPGQERINNRSKADTLFH